MGAISAMSESPLAGNGLGYYFVIVKATNGTEYSIHAYDEKAL